MCVVVWVYYTAAHSCPSLASWTPDNPGSNSWKNGQNVPKKRGDERRKFVTQPDRLCSKMSFKTKPPQSTPRLLQPLTPFPQFHIPSCFLAVGKVPNYSYNPSHPYTVVWSLRGWLAAPAWCCVSVNKIGQARTAAQWRGSPQWGNCSPDLATCIAPLPPLHTCLLLLLLLSVTPPLVLSSYPSCQTCIGLPSFWM